MTEPDPQRALDRLLARSTATRCRRRSDPSLYDDIVQRQDTIETGSQVVEGDDWGC